MASHLWAWLFVGEAFWCNPGLGGRGDEIVKEKMTFTGNQAAIGFEIIGFNLWLRGKTCSFSPPFYGRHVCFWKPWLILRIRRFLSSWRGALIGLKHSTIEQLIALQVSWSRVSVEGNHLHDNSYECRPRYHHDKLSFAYPIYISLISSRALSVELYKNQCSQGTQVPCGRTEVHISFHPATSH